MNKLNFIHFTKNIIKLKLNFIYFTKNFIKLKLKSD